MGLHDQIVEYNWCGTTRYRCPLCPLDHHTNLGIRLHINASHANELMAAAEAEAEAAKPKVFAGPPHQPVADVPLKEPAKIEPAEQAKKEK